MSNLIQRNWEVLYGIYFWSSIILAIIIAFGIPGLGSKIVALLILIFSFISFEIVKTGSY